MTYQQPGAEGGTYKCDECGRMSNDPLPPFYDGGHPKDEKWAHLTIFDMGLDLCSICVRTKLPHVLLTLKRRQEEVPR